MCIRPAVPGKQSFYVGSDWTLSSPLPSFLSSACRSPSHTYCSLLTRATWASPLETLSIHLQSITTQKPCAELQGDCQRHKSQWQLPRYPLCKYLKAKEKTRAVRMTNCIVLVGICFIALIELYIFP